MTNNIINEIRKATMDMMSKISIDEKHNYTNKDGKKLAGVTEVSSYGGYKEAKGWMPAWGAKEAVSYLGYEDIFIGEETARENLKAKLEEIKGMDEKQYLDLLITAKNSYMRKSDKAKDIGTQAHEYLEKYIKAVMRNEKIPSIPKMGEFIEKGIREFIDMTKDWEFVLSEARIGRPQMPYEYAGTLDCLAIIKGIPHIIDFKFADNVSETWKLQTSAYAKPFEDYGINIQERIVFRFPKSEWIKKWDTKKRAYKKIQNKLEIIKYNSGDLDFDFETFCHFRQTAKWINSN